MDGVCTIIGEQWVAHTCASLMMGKKESQTHEGECRYTKDMAELYGCC